MIPRYYCDAKYGKNCFTTTDVEGLEQKIIELEFVLDKAKRRAKKWKLRFEEFPNVICDLAQEIVMLREQNEVLLKALEIACADIHGSGILIINFLPENVEELIKFVTEVAWKELNSNAI